MKVITGKGLNMSKGIKKTDITIRTEDALGNKTLSLSDDATGTMLMIRLTPEIEKMLKEICK